VGDGVTPMRNVTIKRIADGGDQPRLSAMFLHGLGGGGQLQPTHAVAIIGSSAGSSFLRPNRKTVAFALRKHSLGIVRPEQ
jgi:hypothetical protein